MENSAHATIFSTCGPASISFSCANNSNVGSTEWIDRRPSIVVLCLICLLVFWCQVLVVPWSLRPFCRCAKRQLLEQYLSSYPCRMGRRKRFWNQLNNSKTDWKYMGGLPNEPTTHQQRGRKLATTDWEHRVGSSRGLITIVMITLLRLSKTIGAHPETKIYRISLNTSKKKAKQTKQTAFYLKSVAGKVFHYRKSSISRIWLTQIS